MVRKMTIDLRNIQEKTKKISKFERIERNDGHMGMTQQSYRLHRRERGWC